MVTKFIIYSNIFSLLILIFTIQIFNELQNIPKQMKRKNWVFQQFYSKIHFVNWNIKLMRKKGQSCWEICPYWGTHNGVKNGINLILKQSMTHQLHSKSCETHQQLFSNLANIWRITTLTAAYESCNAIHNYSLTSFQKREKLRND